MCVQAAHKVGRLGAKSAVAIKNQHGFHQRDYMGEEKEQGAFAKSLNTLALT
jgi:hypothetical protein